MTTATGFVWHQLYGWHDTGLQFQLPSGGSPVQPLPNGESPESKVRLASLVEATGLGDRMERVRPMTATDEDILRVHTRAYLDLLKRESLAPKGGDAGDGVTPFGHGGLEIARLSAGGAMALVGAVMDGRVRNGYALVRPPGHHALPAEGMGFCMLANIAIAIRWARANLGLGRVAVVDWDVHHGNGTQAIFWDDPDTLTVSLHQDNLYPFGSGTQDERGGRTAPNSALNIPLPAGSGNGAYVAAMERAVVPALHAFRPDLVIVASGFDGSFTDPFGRMMITTTGYRTMTRLLMDAADELCEGRLAMVHEGGYSALYVPYCGLAVLETMSGIATGVTMPWDPDWERLPDQQVTDRQAMIIERAARQAGEIAGSARIPAGTAAGAAGAQTAQRGGRL